MKNSILVSMLWAIASISSEAATIATTLSSTDVIRGLTQTNIASGYLTDTTASNIGVSGSNGSLTRRVDNVVYGFTLPTLSSGESLTGATLDFAVTAYRDQNAGDGDVNLDYYVLNTTDPNTGTGGLGFFRPDNSPGTNEILIGQLDAFTRIDGNQTTITPASEGVVNTALSGSALTYIQSLYDGSGNPTQTEVFFRLNIDSDNGVGQLDRFVIDTSSPALTMTTVVVPEPSSAGLLLCGISSLMLRRRR